MFAQQGQGLESRIEGNNYPDGILNGAFDAHCPHNRTRKKVDLPLLVYLRYGNLGCIVTNINARNVGHDGRFYQILPKESLPNKSPNSYSKHGR